jgi:hypothetical protein
MSWLPTQMPRKGLAARDDLLVQRLDIPGSASRPRRQSAKAPTPGRTMPVG